MLRRLVLGLACVSAVTVTGCGGSSQPPVVVDTESELKTPVPGQQQTKVAKEGPTN